MYFSHILNFKNSALKAAFALFLLFLSFNSFAKQENEAIQNEVKEGNSTAKQEEKFDPTVTILEHIGDSHSWHLWGHTAIPLPVILWTPQGLDIFSSTHLLNEHHEPVAFTSKYTYLNEDEHIKVLDTNGKVDEVASKGIYDFSITKNVAALFISVTLLLIIFGSVANSYKSRVGKAPKGLQSWIEPIIIFIRDDIARPNIGYKFERFMPLLLTVFFFIWINNLLCLVPIFPGSANVTGNIAVTFVLSFIVMIVINLNGNKYYWGHIFKPDVPYWMYIIMIPVEIIGIISKPFALMIRLFANITAGHIIVLSLISLIFIFKTAWMSLASVPFVIFMDVLELLVAFLQAFIFTLLTSLFIGMAVEEHHH